MGELRGWVGAVGYGGPVMAGALPPGKVRPPQPHIPAPRGVAQARSGWFEAAANRTECPDPRGPCTSATTAAGSPCPARSLSEASRTQHLSPAPPSLPRLVLQGLLLGVGAWGCPLRCQTSRPAHLLVLLPVLPEGPRAPLSLPVPLAVCSLGHVSGATPPCGWGQSTCPRLACPGAPLRSVYEPPVRGAQHWAPDRVPPSRSSPWTPHALPVPA